MLSNVEIWNLEKEHPGLPTLLRNSAKKIIEFVWLCFPHHPLKLKVISIEKHL